jgi:acyl-CoA thioesterase-1
MPILPRVPPRPDRRLVVFLGDSITAGYGLEERMAFPSLVQAAWKRLGVPYQAVNEGVSGDKTDDVLARLESSRGPSAELTVLEIGANDAFWAVPVAQVEANLVRIIRALLRGGSRVVLAPMWFEEWFLPAGPDYVREFNGLYERVGKAEGVPVLPPLLRSLFGEPAAWLADGIHPSEAGHQLIARDLLADLNGEWRE